MCALCTLEGAISGCSQLECNASTHDLLPAVFAWPRSSRIVGGSSKWTGGGLFLFFFILFHFIYTYGGHVITPCFVQSQTCIYISQLYGERMYRVYFNILAPFSHIKWKLSFVPLSSGLIPRIGSKLSISLSSPCGLPRLPRLFACSLFSSHRWVALPVSGCVFLFCDHSGCIVAHPRRIIQLSSFWSLTDLNCSDDISILRIERRETLLENAVLSQVALRLLRPQVPPSSSSSRLDVTWLHPLASPFKLGPADAMAQPQPARGRGFEDLEQGPPSPHHPRPVQR